VVQVHHAGDAVESQPVKPELRQPVAQVAEQETEHLRLAVVEQQRVPRRVFASRAGMEVLMIRSVEPVQSLVDVLDGMAVHDVEQHQQPQPVGGVDQFLEVFRRSEPGRGGEEVAHVVAERGVVGVFLNGHQLHDVVSGRRNAGQHVSGEFLVGADSLLLGGHADMSFVDARAVNLWGYVPPRVGGRGIPVLPRPVCRVRLVCQPADVGGDTVFGVRCGVHVYLNPAAVNKPSGGLIVGQENAPDAEFVPGQRVRLAVPAVEITGQEQALCPRRPFAVPDARPALVCAPVQTEVFVAAARCFQRAERGCKAVHGSPVTRVSLSQRLSIGPEPGIPLDQPGAVQFFCGGRETH